MAGTWKPRDFDSSYGRYICHEEMQFGFATGAMRRRLRNEWVRQSRQI